MTLPVGSKRWFGKGRLQKGQANPRGDAERTRLYAQPRKPALVQAGGVTRSGHRACRLVWSVNPSTGHDCTPARVTLRPGSHTSLLHPQPCEEGHTAP